MRTLARSVTLFALLPVLAVACGLTRDEPPPRAVVLAEDDHALREGFDAGLGRVRLVALVSPTCASCAVGIRQLDEVVLAGQPGEKLRVHLVWEALLPSDTLETVTPWMLEIDDPRVTHYWDPETLVGSAYAAPLDVEGPVAWDVYMFFGPTVRWNGEHPPLPLPGEWAHQLPRTAPEHFHRGDDLGVFFARVTEAMER